MRTLLLCLVVGIVFPYRVLADASQNKNYSHAHGMLVVRTTGFKERKGTLALALCRSSEEWNGQKDCFKTARIGVTASTVEYVFNDLPEGEYAIKAFQDENGNRTLDKDLMGVPVERYGFSNNARGLFDPPSYKKAAFIFTCPSMAVEIRMNNFYSDD